MGREREGRKRDQSEGQHHPWIQRHCWSFLPQSFSVLGGPEVILNFSLFIHFGKLRKECSWATQLSNAIG